MRLKMLKLFYAIEIGAYLAYKGHYEASGNVEIRRISKEELKHMILLKNILDMYGETPNIILNVIFLVIGYNIRLLCKIIPKFLLNRVAESLEVINVINYEYAAKQFPIFKDTFIEMQENEKEHEMYFKSLRFDAS